MALVSDDPKELRGRAKEARALAENTTDPELAKQLFEIATIYENLADSVEQKTDQPRSKRMVHRLEIMAQSWLKLI